METDKKLAPVTDPKKAGKENKTKEKKEKELDRELDQTFPASDPPAHTDQDREERERRRKQGKE